MRDDRNLRNPFSGRIAELYRLRFGAVLNLDRAAFICTKFLAFAEIRRDDLVVVILHRTGQVGLNMAQRGVAHRI
ncbi:hypothetical protein D3C71_1911210 [compost metagenome]